MFVCFVSTYVEIERFCDQSLGIFQFLETGPRIFLQESRFSVLFSRSQEDLAFFKELEVLLSFSYRFCRVLVGFAICSNMRAQMMLGGRV